MASFITLVLLVMELRLGDLVRVHNYWMVESGTELILSDPSLYYVNSLISMEKYTIRVKGSHIFHLQ